MVPSFCKLKLPWPVKLGMAFVKSISFYEVHVSYKVIIFTLKISVSTIMLACGKSVHM